MTAYRVEPGDAETVLDVWRQRWSGEVVYTPRGAYGARDVASFRAVAADGRLFGLVTFVIERGLCGLVTMNAILDGHGVGTKLLDAALAEARAHGAERVVATLTNDNLRAYAFFQKRGFRLVALRPDAIAEVRLKKPKIPLVAPNGIPIRDYLDVERAP